MKNPKHKKTTAKLSDKEAIVGGDAPGTCLNKQRNKEMLKLIEEADKKEKQKK